MSNSIRLLTWAVALLCSTTAITCCHNENDNSAVVAEQAFVPKAPDYSDPTMWVTEDDDVGSMGADVFYVVSTWEEDWMTADGTVSQKILLGDVIQRNKVKNEMALRLTIKRLADNVMQPTSYNRVANLVKGTGVSTSVASVIDYVRYAKEACMLFPLDNYTSKFAEKETVKKHYFVDNGLLCIFLIGGETALLENLCAVHLYRKYEGGLYFYNKGIEVDFVVPDESYAVQVSCSINDEDTRKREVDGLKKLHTFLPLKRMVIVTFDEEETVKLGDGCIIEVIPAWKWLLE